LPTPRMAALSPGLSPPAVMIPIRFNFFMNDQMAVVLPPGAGQPKAKTPHCQFPCSSGGETSRSQQTLAETYFSKRTAGTRRDASKTQKAWKHPLAKPFGVDLVRLHTSIPSPRGRKSSRAETKPWGKKIRENRFAACAEIWGLLRLICR
jgi:hypothetical protein